MHWLFPCSGDVLCMIDLGRSQSIDLKIKLRGWYWDKLNINLSLLVFSDFSVVSHLKAISAVGSKTSIL